MYLPIMPLNPRPLSLSLLTLLVFAPALLAAQELKNEQEETFYAMGAILGRKLTPSKLSAKELDLVRRGFLDAASGKKLKVDEKELEEFGPKIDLILSKRTSPEAEAQRAKGVAFAEQVLKEPGALRTKSGLVLRTLKPGEGGSPAATDKVRVSYESRLLDGTVFDSSVQHGGPTSFRLNQVLPCWTEAVQLMKLGEKAKLVCPASLAYGAAGRPPQIPGGAALVFEVELLAFEK